MLILVSPIYCSPSERANVILNQTDQLINQISSSSPSYMKLVSIRSLMEEIIEEGVNETELRRLEGLKETVNETVVDENRARAKTFFLLIFGASTVAFALALLQKLRKVDGEILDHLENNNKLLTTNQIAESLNRSWATVQSHLLKMLSDGVVEHTRVGNVHGWKLNKKGRFLEND